MLPEKYKNIKVLCVEDEQDIRKNQVDYLKRIFYHVYEAPDAQKALDIIKNEEPQLVITDIQMSQMSGLEMIRFIRKDNKNIRFIVLSAFSNKEYLLDAIDLGLVKYLIKPIDHETLYPILMQCIEEIALENSGLITLCDNCTFDTNSSTLQLNDETFILSKYEADFLMLLFKKRPNVVTYDQIQYEVWAANIMSDHSLRTLVKSLRKKLPKNMIRNLSKVGYKFEQNI